MSQIILRAQDTRKLLGIKVIADANLDAQQMSNLAQLISDQSLSLVALSWSKGQKTKQLCLVLREGRVHIKSDTADHFVERGGYFGHEMLGVAGMLSQCAVYHCSRGTGLAGMVS
jgi:hypothetical protein